MDTVDGGDGWPRVERVVARGGQGGGEESVVKGGEVGKKAVVQGGVSGGQG